MKKTTVCQYTFIEREKNLRLQTRKRD